MPPTAGWALNVFLRSHYQGTPSIRLDRDEMDAVIDDILTLKSDRKANPRGKCGLARTGGTAAMLTYPVLLADVVGTYARFAVLVSTGTHPTPIWKVATADFHGPLAAIQAYLNPTGRNPTAFPSSPSQGGSMVA
ncbi:MAG: hypothetical protein K2Y56_03305 [Methylobacterium sp.]|uniref:hypothetical protein n=1 Tax=Methylobacterium sp. TaxID=409 RepID=UPI0025E8A40B|nr:hypothetical protein [Methylobacterium sp.]MBX9930556.1 hypothetical protein [Methylobacterium sp.]